MRPRARTSRIAYSGPVKYSIIVAVLGVIGLLVIVQWTAYTVRNYIRVASQSVFPAALSVQSANTAFEKMNHEYSNAVLMQDSTALADAAREASLIELSMGRASVSMEFNPMRHEQIVTLTRRVAGLQARSRILYAAATQTNAIVPQQNDLADLTRENQSVGRALDALQSDLAGDFRDDLALIDKLQMIQGMLQALVLGGVIFALYFGVRSYISATVRQREDEVLRQTHAELEAERRILRALIDNIPDFMYVKDAEGRFVVANASLASVVGLETPEAMLGKTDFDFFPPELAQAFYEDEQSVKRTGQLQSWERHLTGRAGNVVHYVTTKVPLRDSQGSVTGLAGIGHDISKRKRMESELREAELKYRGIFDKAIVGIFQCTPEGRFLNVNPAMAFNLGYNSPDEMVASIVDIVRQFFVNRKRGVEFMLVMDKVGGVKNFECEVYQKDGCKKWFTMSIRAIRENGVVVRYEGMCEDITERNLLREQLLQAQKLESVGQLAAGIAHEINTPTQYIGDNVRFLKDAFEDLKSLLVNYERLMLAAKDNIVYRDAIQDIEAVAQRADSVYLLEEIPTAIDQTLEGVARVTALVSAMKEFSHPDTKEKVLVDLNRAIASTITVARSEWKYVADMETEFDPALPLVSCLPGEFNQVILNLIVNAAHAIAEVTNKEGSGKGKIKVQTRHCLEWAEIRLQDSGSGIPGNIRARIFDPFFTTKEIGKGTGQGLTIARSIVVDKHGGTIHFESEEGKGTTFIIRLPYNGKALAAKAVAA